MGGDPVQAGLVASMNRPGGNVTGFTLLTNEMEAKRLGILHDLVPVTRRSATYSMRGSARTSNSATRDTSLSSAESTSVQPVAADQVDVDEPLRTRDGDLEHVGKRPLCTAT